MPLLSKDARPLKLNQVNCTRKGAGRLMRESGMVRGAAGGAAAFKDSR
jgi:hypothetical protein